MPLNINVGLLGHVDSGKTSLSKVLSKIASTSAFDKNPQSQQRGITLDLGFSALTIDAPESLKSKTNDELIFTFVDCPGHNSLIRTIIGGNLIIDLMILVVDIQKGFEAQTGECLILGEISKKPMIVVLNKIDMISDIKRESTIEKMTKKVSKTLEGTIFKGSKIIPISATNNINIEKLIDSLVEETCKMNLRRNIEAPFIFAFDHCFAIKGSGTILSGTVLRGSIKINDNIEIPNLKLEKKIKSMQIFKKPVEKACAGDRVGICITNFDSKLLERGLICQKGCTELAHATVIKLNRVKYFKRDIKSKSKFHFSIGHDTVMASIIIFSSKSDAEFDIKNEYLYEDQVVEEDSDSVKSYFALIEFETPALIYDDILLIASKFDTEQTNVCRLAFYGNVLIKNSSIDKNNHEAYLQKFKIYKVKCREGNIQRFVTDNELIAINLFKKETDRSKFERMKCQLSTGEIGTISLFGQASKVKIQFTTALQQATIDSIKNSKSEIKVFLSFKKFIFDKNHRMIQ